MYSTYLTSGRRSSYKVLLKAPGYNWRGLWRGPGSCTKSGTLTTTMREREGGGHN